MTRSSPSHTNSPSRKSSSSTAAKSTPRLTWSSARRSASPTPRWPTNIRSSGGSWKTPPIPPLGGVARAKPALGRALDETDARADPPVAPTGTLAGFQADEEGRRPAPLPGEPVVLGDQVDVVRPLEPRVGYREGVEERLAEPDHGVARLARVLVLLPAQEPDEVQHRHLAVHGHAAERVNRGVEPGVLDHQHERLPAGGQAGPDRVGLVRGGAREDADRALLVERSQHRLLVGVGHAQHPAERLGRPRRPPALGGQPGPGLAEGVLQRVDDERRGNGFRHSGLLVAKPALYYQIVMSTTGIAFDHIAIGQPRIADTLDLLVGTLGGVPEAASPSRGFNFGCWL